MFSIEGLILGQSVTNQYLNDLIENTTFNKVDDEIIADWVSWDRELSAVASILHLDLAPNGSVIHADEYSRGFASMTKYNGVWYVTKLYYSNHLDYAA